MFVFYQNILSIHQSALIRSLAETCPVTLVVPEEMDETRIAHGWKRPDFGQAKVVVNPDDQQLDVLLQKKEAVHIFAGIDAFELPYKAFRIAVKRRLRIGFYSEPFNWLGWKGKLRLLKYTMLRIRYERAIDFVLAIGERGRWCFEKAGFPKQKIFDWGYFTEQPVLRNLSQDTKGLVKLLFIGSIDHRKNILGLVDVCLSMPCEQPFTLDVIGVGPLEKELNEKITASDRICYIGCVPNDAVHTYLSAADCLILPSVFDGWGAVVNEALLCGTPVLASNRCGASVLLTDEERGCTFSIERNELKTALIRQLNKGRVETAQRERIRQWADKAISGKQAAAYLTAIVRYRMKQTAELRPVAPWLKDGLNFYSE